MMMNLPTAISILLPLLLAILFIAAATSALHADEAGINDFLLRSAGHGDVGVQYSRVVSYDNIIATSKGSARRENVWVTSQSCENPSGIVDDGSFLEGGGGGGSDDGASSSAKSGGSMLLPGGGGGTDEYCSIAARDVDTGDVLWRVNACSTTSKSNTSSGSVSNSNKFIPRHATLASSQSTVYSLDDTGILRGYNAGSGQLTLDTDIFATIDPSDNDNSNWVFPGGVVPRLLDGNLAIGTVVSKRGDGDDDESLVLLDTNTGQPIKEEGYHSSTSSTPLLSAKSLLSKAKVSSKKGGRAHIVAMHIIDEDRVGIWVAWTTGDGDKKKGSSSSSSGESRIVSTFASMAFVEVALTPKPTSDGKKEVLVYKIVRTTPLTGSADDVALSTPIFLSSLRTAHHRNEKMISLLAISSTSSQLVLTTVDLSTAKSKHGQIVEIDILHPYWRYISSIHVDTLAYEGSPYHVVRVAGMDDRYSILPRRTESLFLLNGSNNGGGVFQRVYGPDKHDEEDHHDALAYCADMGVVVAAELKDGVRGTVATMLQIDAKDLMGGSSSRILWTPRMEGEDDSDVVIVPHSKNRPVKFGLVRYAHLVDCSKEGMTVAFTTLGGMTTTFRFDSKGSSGGQVNQLWSSEEALGSISSAIFLDETRAATLQQSSVAVDADEEEEKALQSLRFDRRIRSQLSSFNNFIFGGGILSSIASLALLSDEKKAERDLAFGFAKISVLLSERLHRIVALDTANKGRVVWSMNLHPGAAWHKLVHGGQFVTLNDPHGNGGVHDHEMLSLSYVEGSNTDSDASVEWQCFDGTTGRSLSHGTLHSATPVVQIVPLRTSTHHHHHPHEGCRQVALLVHSDHTVRIVPDIPRSYAIVDEAMSSSSSAGHPNGLFVHTVDRETGEFHSFRLSRKTT